MGRGGAGVAEAEPRGLVRGGRGAAESAARAGVRGRLQQAAWRARPRRSSPSWSLSRAGCSYLPRCPPTTGGCLASTAPSSPPPPIGPTCGRRALLTPRVSPTARTSLLCWRWTVCIPLTPDPALTPYRPARGGHSLVAGPLDRTPSPGPAFKPLGLSELERVPRSRRSLSPDVCLLGTPVQARDHGVGEDMRTSLGERVTFRRRG